MGGSEVRSSVLEDEFRFGKFKVRFSDGSGSSRFAIFRFVPTLVHICTYILAFSEQILALSKLYLENVAAIEIK